MYRKYIALFITLFMMNGCGEEESSGNSTQTNVDSETKTNFTYKTQEAVKVSITTPKLSTSSQRQVLLFETQKSTLEENTPGEILTFESLLAKGNTVSDGTYEVNLTLGGHIQSIWVVIPSLAYEKNIEIVDNQITLTITEGL